MKIPVRCGRGRVLQCGTAMSDDIELLRRYAEEGSEEAFRDLVSRHIDLVYSAARRGESGPSGVGGVGGNDFTGGCDGGSGRRS